MRADLGLSGFLEQRLTLRAGWKQSCALAEAICFFGQTIFKGLDLLETATMLHDTTHLFTGPNRRA